MKSFHEIEEKIKALCSSVDARGIYVLTDSNVDLLTREFLPDLPRLAVEAGEENKSLEGARQVWNFLEGSNAVRKSVLINLGGGMVSDLGGFAASTYKRGIQCINLPTTLLAAVDAAIGGKTGINYAGLKNEIGTFHMPLAVIPVTSLFQYLPKQEWLSGAGEAIKTALLDSESLFNLATSDAFLKRRDQQTVDEVVRRCANFKERIVSQDFREGGLRKILNLGHTAGHAIESWSLAKGKPIPHGVAVAYGLLETLNRSRHLPDADPSLWERVERVIKDYFPVYHFSAEDRAEIEEYMCHDKKCTVAGTPQWILLPAISRPVIPN